MTPMNPALCAPPPVSGLAASLLADTDCQAFGLVERGYAALSSPDSSTGAALTGLMVIAVALFGYRLLLGRGFALSDVTGLVIRLGVVLLIAASWSTWQTVAYDTLARAPTRIASELIASVDGPSPLVGLQTVLDQIDAGSVGWRQRAGIASPLVGGPASTATALNLSSFFLVLTTVGLLVIARLILALLLAIAPVMAGFLLFNATRGLLEGWLRAMVGAALVPLAVLTLFSIELAVVRPMLDRMLAQQASGVFEGASVTPIALVVIVFSLAILAATRAVGSIARGVRIPAFGTSTRGASDVTVLAAPTNGERQLLLTGPQERPQMAVSRALEHAVRREGDVAASPGAGRIVSAAMRGTAGAAGATRATSTTTSTVAPTGRTYVAPARTRLTRASRASSRRDI